MACQLEGDLPHMSFDFKFAWASVCVGRDGIGEYMVDARSDARGSYTRQQPCIMQRSELLSFFVTGRREGR